MESRDAPAADPFIGGLAFDNIAPKTNDMLVVNLQGVVAADQFQYVWQVNGVTVRDETLTTWTDSLDLAQAGNGDKNDTIAVTVIPMFCPGQSNFNGNSCVFGAAVATSATVANTAPVMDSVSIVNVDPKTNETLTVNVAATDADGGDTISYEYAWYVNGALVSATTDTLDLSQPGFGDKGDVIYVTVTPSDGTASAAAMSSDTATVANTAPVMSSVAIDNVDPKTNETLTLNVAGDDVDGDTVTFEYAWYVNGAQVSATADTLDLSQPDFGDKGDAIYVTVTPTDGAASGDALSSSTVTVADTAPIIDTVTLNNATPKTNEGLNAQVTATDADGDEIALNYYWYVDFVALSEPSASLDLSQPGSGDKGQMVWVVVEASADGASSALAYSGAATVANTAPVAQNDDSYSIHHGTTLVAAPLENDTDADSDIIAPSVLVDPAHGSAYFDSLGQMHYSPVGGFTGTDTLTYRLHDGAEYSEPATITISVTNTAPVASPYQYYLHAGGILSLDSTDGLLHDAFDMDGDSLTAELVGAGPAHGTLTIHPDGSLTYASTGFAGNDSFDYRVFDGASYSDVYTANIHVENQVPLASADSFDVWVDQGIVTASANVLANDRDPDYDALTVVLEAGPSYAESFQLYADGAFAYMPTATPPTNWNGEDSFSYRAFDGVNFSNIVTVSLHVTSVPLPRDDGYLLDVSGYLSVASGALLENDFNPMNAQVNLEFIVDIAADIGTFVFNVDGSFTFTAGVNFQDEVTFSYRWLIQQGEQFFPTPTAAVRILVGNVLQATTRLDSVDYETNATIVDDNGARFGDPAEWHAARGIYPLQEDPISFTRNTKIQLTPTFFIDPLMVAFWQSCGDHILVRAQSISPAAQIQVLRLGYDQVVRLQLQRGDGGDIQAFLVTNAAVEMDSPLADRTAFYQMNLSWQISPDGGLNWIAPNGNISRNQTFVTLADPVGGGDIRHSVLYAGVQGNNVGLGATDNASLLSEVWSAFQTRTITRANGTAMEYWGDWTATVAATTFGLLEANNGQCYAWASLFVDTLRAWGDPVVSDQVRKRLSTNPTQTNYGVVPDLAPVGNRNDNSFLVGNWTFGEDYIQPNTVDVLQGWTNFAVLNPYDEFFLYDDDGYLWTNGPLPPNTPTPGQNSTDPLSAFQNHMVVLIDGVLYDPSYGVTYAYDPTSDETKVAGFVATLGGFMTVIPFNNNSFNFDLNNTGVNNNTSYWVVLFKPIWPSMLLLR